MLYLGKEVCMAKFVPFIIKTDGSQNISVKIVRMKKSDAVQTEKEPVWQMNCTPFVRQYGILFRKWGVFVCQRDNESTTELKR